MVQPMEMKSGKWDCCWVDRLGYRMAGLMADQ